MKDAVAEPTLNLDLPAPGEAVTSPYYSLRVDAPEAAFVAVSIDDGSWIPCRFTAGYWRHEWSGYAPGLHVVKAQSRAVDGTIRAHVARRVVVRFLGQDDERPETD